MSINISDFEMNLAKIPAGDWNRFFALLPEIEKTIQFGEYIPDRRLDENTMHIPYWVQSDLVSEFVQTFYNIGLCVVFDWGWQEGTDIMDQEDFDYSTLDSLTLCKLLTKIVRADRFSEGALIKYFENGIIPKIIRALKENHTKPGMYALPKIKAALLGVAVGDALGVPVEFSTREDLQKNPVTDMMGFGTYPVPPGTWSDDSSLTFCLAEALTEGYDLHTIAQNFVKWRDENYWTATGRVFDIGNATNEAIERFKSGVKPELAGGRAERDNGNGSLMRILPLMFYIRNKPIEERFAITKEVSSITHGHTRSVMACFVYLEFARHLLYSTNRSEALNNMNHELSEFLPKLGIEPAELAHFESFYSGGTSPFMQNEIQSSGYVIHTLYASIRCLLDSKNYSEAVLKAVNLGSDTDTTAAVTGGLAAIAFGIDSIPEKWLQTLARRHDIEDLAERLSAKLVMDYRSYVHYLDSIK
jgi:ADP-ribosyl-[dinitrogen reductase] hydrolase